MVEMFVVVNFLVINYIFDKFLVKVEKLGIFLDDIEVIVVIFEYYFSQLLVVLVEIENWVENIRCR